MSANSFGSRGSLDVNGRSYEVYRLEAVDGAARLPYSLKILLENLLRTEDGANITADHIRALAGWDPAATPSQEIQFTPARVIMQDFTGVPCVVDLAAMREAVKDLGGDPAKVNPLAPAELVIDHSVQADVFARPDAFELNTDLEYERNVERYEFLRWGQTAFDEFRVVPPGTGIVHQVNLEYLARTVMTRTVDGTLQAYPTPSSARTRTRRWSTGSASWAGAWAASRPRPRCSASRCRCSSRRSWASSSPAGCPRAPRRPTSCSPSRRCCARKAWSASSSSSTATASPGLRLPTARRSPTWRPSTAPPAASSRSTRRRCRYLTLTGRREEPVALVEAYAKMQGLWHTAGLRSRSTPTRRARPRHGRNPRSPARSDRRTAWRCTTRRPAAELVDREPPTVADRVR